MKDDKTCNNNDAENRAYERFLVTNVSLEERFRYLKEDLIQEEVKNLLI